MNLNFSTNEPFHWVLTLIAIVLLSTSTKICDCVWWASALNTSTRCLVRCPAPDLPMSEETSPVWNGMVTLNCKDTIQIYIIKARHSFVCVQFTLLVFSVINLSKIGSLTFLLILFLTQIHAHGVNLSIVIRPKSSLTGDKPCTSYWGRTDYHVCLCVLKLH